MRLFSDVLSIAVNSIPREKIQYRKYIGENVNDNGIVSQNFTEWSDALAVVEPGIVSSFGGNNINERDYKELGLDWSRNYVTIWGHLDLHTALINRAPDQVRIRGKIFNIIQTEDWIVFSGWKRMYCEERTDEDE